jgi:hypothetical protein
MSILASILQLEGYFVQLARENTLRSFLSTKEETAERGSLMLRYNLIKNTVYFNLRHFRISLYVSSEKKLGFNDSSSGQLSW